MAMSLQNTHTHTPTSLIFTLLSCSDNQMFQKLKTQELMNTERSWKSGFIEVEISEIKSWSHVITFSLEFFVSTSFLSPSIRKTQLFYIKPVLTNRQVPPAVTELSAVDLKFNLLDNDLLFFSVQILALVQLLLCPVASNQRTRLNTQEDDSVALHCRQGQRPGWWRAAVIIQRWGEFRWVCSHDALREEGREWVPEVWSGSEVYATSPRWESKILWPDQQRGHV